MVKEHIHHALNGDRYLVVHGDGFDTVSTDYKWVAALGAIGYDQLMKVNRLYNRYRSWCGKDYFSMSKAIKSKVKSAVSFVDRYQDQLQMLAKRKGCQGIICGHIHTAADEQLEGIHYLNSGDWVESLSAVVEHPDGRFEVLYYEDFLQRIHAMNEIDEGPAREELERDIVDLEKARSEVLENSRAGEVS
jgi:UDP-2,3-diacylglucosamine pyrophosphatase LpxH